MLILEFVTYSWLLIEATCDKLTKGITHLTIQCRSNCLSPPSPSVSSFFFFLYYEDALKTEPSRSFDPQMPDPAFVLKCWPKKQGRKVTYFVLSYQDLECDPMGTVRYMQLQRKTEAFSFFGERGFVAVVLRSEILLCSGKWCKWNPVSNFVLDSHLNFWKEQQKISSPRSGMNTDK